MTNKKLTKKPDEPKKHGGGGKGTWGLPGCEINVDGTVSDSRDPNYVPDEEDKNVVYAAIDAPAPIPLFKEQVISAVKEYFVSRDVDEITRQLVEAVPAGYEGTYHPLFVKYAISVALDFGNHEKELLSALFPRICPNPVSHERFAEGFELSIERVDDWVVDAPEAVNCVGNFLARAVVDEVLFPAFFQKSRAHVEAGSKAAEAMELARSKLEKHHGYTLLAKVWGPGDSNEDVKSAITQLIEEYFECYDYNEAARCIRELEAPSFHHEVVKKAIVLSLSRSAEAQDAISRLIHQLHENGLVASPQVRKGFERVVESIDDIELDNPNARQAVRAFAAAALQSNVLQEPVVVPESRK